jgi:3-phenylpropionate/trans-cinnamate dioxygenase ferredoxin reductase subunit
VPFVWSDQYDLKIQVVGHVRGDDEIAVVDGSLEERRFVAAVGRAGRLVGAVGFGRPRVLMQYRRMIAERCSWDAALSRAEAVS